VQDCTIDTDLEILIPDDYVESITERLSLYQRLDNSETEEELQLMAEEMKDRFGDLPQAVNDLFVTVRCRKLAVELGFEKMSLKDETLRCYFINRPDSPYFESQTFQQILSFIQTGTNKAKLKQSGRLFSMIVNEVRSMEKCTGSLLQCTSFVFSENKEAWSDFTNKVSKTHLFFLRKWLILKHKSGYENPSNSFHHPAFVFFLLFPFHKKMKVLRCNFVVVKFLLKKILHRSM
jgi:hypothetical protein